MNNILDFRYINYILLFLVYFIITFFLGYDTLNRYDYDLLLSEQGALSDVNTYIKTVENGLVGLYDNRFAPRILVPILSHLVYLVAENNIGSWNITFFSLLFVNSFFVALTCILIINITKILNLGSPFLPAFFFITSFGVNSLFLSGLVDSSLCFFISFLIYGLLK